MTTTKVQYFHNSTRDTGIGSGETGVRGLDCKAGAGDERQGYRIPADPDDRSGPKPRSRNAPELGNRSNGRPTGDPVAPFFPSSRPGQGARPALWVRGGRRKLRSITGRSRARRGSVQSSRGLGHRCPAKPARESGAECGMVNPRIPMAPGCAWRQVGPSHDVVRGCGSLTSASDGSAESTT